MPMPGITYTGARYVPKFAEPMQWDKQNEYEPLTIVLYKGNSYTSKQLVKAGTDILNTEYWAETGNYNAQIELYREEVHYFDKRIETNTNDIATNASDISKEIARATASEDIIKAEYTKVYDTVNDMKKDPEIKKGMTVKTNGFNLVNDNGGAFYKVIDVATANEFNVITLNNGLFAELIDNDPLAVPEKYGAYGDGDKLTAAHDDTNVFKFLIEAGKAIQLSKKQYWLKSSPIIQADSVTATKEISINGTPILLDRWSGGDYQEKACALRLSDSLYKYTGSDIESFEGGITGNITGVSFINVSADNSELAYTATLIKGRIKSLLFNYNSTHGFSGAFDGALREVTMITNNKFQQLKDFFMKGSVFDVKIDHNHIQGRHQTPTFIPSICFDILHNSETSITNNFIDYWEYILQTSSLQTFNSMNNQYGGYVRILKGFTGSSVRFKSINDYFAGHAEGGCLFEITSYTSNITLINPEFSDKVTTVFKLIENKASIRSGLCEIINPQGTSKIYDLIDLNGHTLPVNTPSWKIDTVIYNYSETPAADQKTWKGERIIYNDSELSFYAMLYVNYEWVYKKIAFA